MKTILLITTLFVQLKLCSSSNKPYYQISQHPDLVQTNVEFSFQGEGFDESIFTTKLSKTLNRFERDIQRKTNKLSELKGNYNYTKVITGDALKYMAVDTVDCFLIDSCISTRPLKNCQAIKCIAPISHNNMDEAEVEYSMLAVTEAFFKFTDFKDYDKVMFNGPFPMNTTTAIQLVGVNTDSPITNSDTEFFLNSTQAFLDQLDDYLGYDMRIRSMNLSTQNTITLNDKHFLFTVVSYYSVHEFKPPMKKIFESKVNKHIESNGNDLVNILTAGDIDYFRDVIEARNALTVSELEDHRIHTMDTNDENSVLKNVLQEVDEEDNEYTNSYTAAVSGLQYVYEEETKVENQWVLY